MRGKNLKLTKIDINSYKEDSHLITITNSILRKITYEKSQITLWCFLQTELKPYINILQNINQFDDNYELFHGKIKTLFDKNLSSDLKLENKISQKLVFWIKKNCLKKDKIKNRSFFSTMRAIIDLIEDNFVHYPEEFSLQSDDLKRKKGYTILPKPTTDPFYLADLKSFLKTYQSVPDDINSFLEEKEIIPTRLFYPYCINNYNLIQSNNYSIIHHPRDYLDNIELDRFRMIILNIPFEKRKFTKIGKKCCKKICTNSHVFKICRAIPFLPLYDPKDTLQGKIFLLKDNISSKIEKMISKHIQKEIDPINSLVILPELSVSEKISRNLRNLILDKFQFFIGGSYYKVHSETNIRNICPINFNHKLFHYRKSLRARNLIYCDDGTLQKVDEGITEDNILHIFDSPLGRFSVLICSDFIGGEQLTALIESSCCDMIFIPTLTPYHSIEKDFHDKSKVLARSKIMTVCASHGFIEKSFFYVPIRLSKLEEAINSNRKNNTNFDIKENGNGFFIIQKEGNKDLVFPKWKELFH